MAISGGPDIVEDGLVLHLDAAEPLCFRGEPTTNLVRYPVPNTSWTLGNAQGSAGTRSFLTENGVDYMRLSNITAPSSTSYPRIVDQTLTSTVTGNVTASFEARGTTGSIVNFNIYENGSTKHSLGATMTSEWKRYSYSFNTSFNLNQPYFQPRTTGATYDIRNVQIEAKPYATNFVSGTRGSTVATGGGLLDLTNNGNNGTINRTSVPSAAFYSGNNGGSFVFDGSNDYVSVGEITGSFSDFTILFWFYTGDLGDLENILDCNYNVYPSTGNVGPRFELRNLNSGADKYLTFVISGNTSNNLIYQTGGVIPNGSLSSNTWYHAGLVKESSTLYPVHNGTKGSAISLSQGFVSSMGNLQIGRGFHLSGAERYFSDKVTIVQIYNRPLSSDEILQNYNATKGRYGL